LLELFPKKLQGVKNGAAAPKAVFFSVDGFLFVNRLSTKRKGLFEPKGLIVASATKNSFFWGESKSRFSPGAFS
jgi:hypothetical protein